MYSTMPSEPHSRPSPEYFDTAGRGGHVGYDSGLEAHHAESDLFGHAPDPIESRLSPLLQNRLNGRRDSAVVP